MPDLELIAKALWYAGWFASEHNYHPPKIGDLVFEMTAGWDDDIRFIDQVGRLKEGDIIETLDGREVAWSNHKFKTIPESFEYRKLLECKNG